MYSESKGAATGVGPGNNIPVYQNEPTPPFKGDCIKNEKPFLAVYQDQNQFWDQELFSNLGRLEDRIYSLLALPSDPVRSLNGGGPGLPGTWKLNRP